MPQESCWQDASAGMRDKAATPLLIYQQANKVYLMRDKAWCQIYFFKSNSSWSYYFTVLQLIDVGVPVWFKLNTSSGTVYQRNVNY